MESGRAADGSRGAAGDSCDESGERGVREIVIDTETTGLDPNDGHRIVEIACIELMHHVPTGRKFHRYLNPVRDMPADALAVHGITAEFLASQPLFEAIADDLAAFIAGDRLVIHNAEFDLAFLNAELARLGRPPLACPFVDTLAVARRRFPGAPASLDALCRRFVIDLTVREKHGADIDCGLLAQVYIELLGGRQPGLDFAAPGIGGIAIALPQDRPPRPPRPHAASLEELAAHQAMLAAIKTPLWLAA
jgi:DNA polymerase-3 subunit epsilon